uniref:Sodium-dependent multivitamin transporter n=1 Tax=Strigamia maritima TaxID=126957 RepID=T1JCV0_STRMM
MAAKTSFGVVDYVVFGIMLLISAAIGVYYRFTGGKQKSNKEYLLADKNMNVIPVGFSLMASFMSAITLLGVSSENYVYGTQFVIINFSYIFGTFIAAYLYLPVFFHLQVTSAYEYLELRFGKITRRTASGAFILQMVLYMSIVLYAPALALNAVTGIEKWISIVAVGLVCTFYSTVGGMKAVLWTDLFQALLMFAAVFTVIIAGLVEFKGFSAIWDIADRGKRIEFFNFNPDPTVRHTVWTQMFGGIFVYTSLYGVNQAQIQRLMTVKTLKKSQTALFLNWPILTVLSLTTSFSGLVIYAKYHDCDPLLTKHISAPDQLLPLFVMDFLSQTPGVAGLFVSGIFSGALSTVSSAVNSLAAVTLEDFIKPIIRTDFSERKLSFISQALALSYGLICVALAFVAEQLGGVLQASLTIFGLVGGPLLGLFSLGMFFPKSNEKGALAGLITSLILCFWIGFGATYTRPYNPILPQSDSGCFVNNSSEISELLFNVTNISESVFMNASSTVHSILDPSEKNKNILYVYRLSYMWMAPIGFTITFVVGLIVSLLTGGNETNPDLLSPPIAKYQKRAQEQYSSVAINGEELSQLSKIHEENHY